MVYLGRRGEWNKACLLDRWLRLNAVSGGIKYGWKNLVFKNYLFRLSKSIAAVAVDCENQHPEVCVLNTYSWQELIMFKSKIIVIYEVSFWLRVYSGETALYIEEAVALKFASDGVIRDKCWVCQKVEAGELDFHLFPQKSHKLKKKMEVIMIVPNWSGLQLQIEKHAANMNWITFFVCVTINIRAQSWQTFWNSDSSFGEYTEMF